MQEVLWVIQREWVRQVEVPRIGTLQRKEETNSLNNKDWLMPLMKLTKLRILQPSRKRFLEKKLFSINLEEEVPDPLKVDTVAIIQEWCHQGQWLVNLGITDLMTTRMEMTGTKLMIQKMMTSCHQPDLQLKQYQEVGDLVCRSQPQDSLIQRNVKCLKRRDKERNYSDKQMSSMKKMTFRRPRKLPRNNKC